MVERASIQKVLIVLPAIIIGACAITIRLPRKNVMTLEQFKNAANAGDWYVFYYGTSGSLNFTNTKYTFNWSDPNVLILERKANVGNACDIETISLVTDTNQAVFASDGNYRAFVSAEQNDYMFLFECASISTIPRFCPLDDTTVVFLVKNIRPDSLPLRSAVRELRSNTKNQLSFGSTLGDFSFKFLGLDEPPCA